VSDRSSFCLFSSRRLAFAPSDSYARILIATTPTAEARTAAKTSGDMVEGRLVKERITQIASFNCGTRISASLIKEQITGVVRQLLWLSPTIVSADVAERGCFPNSPSEPYPTPELRQSFGTGRLCFRCKVRTQQQPLRNLVNRVWLRCCATNHAGRETNLAQLSVCTCKFMSRFRSPCVSEPLNGAGLWD
jgi:hypothetical protein